MNYEKLPQEFKNNWTSALRSGEYKQGKGELCKGGKFCCLGVAAIVAGYSEEQITRRSEGKHTDINKFEDLPSVLMVNNVHDLKSASMVLQDMNDKGKQFSEIADWIEANL